MLQTLNRIMRTMDFFNFLAASLNDDLSREGGNRITFPVFKCDHLR